MAQSYRKRFAGQEEAIRNDLALLGESPAADRWGAVSGEAWHKYACKLLGRPPEYATKFAHADLGQLAHYIVADLLATLQAQREEIAGLRAQLAEVNQAHALEIKRVKMSSVELMRALANTRY